MKRLVCALLLVAAQFCAAGALGRTDEGMEQRASASRSSSEPVLKELNEFDAAGWIVRGLDMVDPDFDLDSFDFVVHSFVGEYQTRAMSDLFEYLIFKHRNGAFQDFCLDLTEKSQLFDRTVAHNNARNIVVAGVRAGLLPADALAHHTTGVPFSTGTKDVWLDGAVVKGDYFGMREEDALRAIVRHPATSDDLVMVAEGMLNFLLTLEADDQLVDAIESMCRGDSMRTELRLEGWIDHTTDNDEGCDPAIYGQRLEHETPLLTSRMMEFLVTKGVRDFRLRCINVASFVQNVQLGTIEISNSRIAFVSLENSAIVSVDIRNSTVSDLVSLLGSTISGAVRLEELEIAGSLFLNRMRSEGRVDVLKSKVDGIDLYQSSLLRGLTIGEVEGAGVLNMNAMQSDGPIVVRQSNFQHSINLVRATLGDDLTVSEFDTAGHANFTGLRSAGVVNISNAVFSHSLSLRNSILGQGLLISGMSTNGFGNFEGIRSQGRFEIVDSDFGALPANDDLPIDPTVEKNTFYARSAQVDDILHLRNVRVAGDLSLTNGRASSIQLYDVQVSRDLVLGAIQVAGPVLVGNSGVGTVVGRDLDLTATRASMMQIVHSYIGGNLWLSRVGIDTRLYLYRVLAAKGLTALGASADSFEMFGVASPRIDLTGNLFERGVDFHSVVSDLVLADRMEASFIRLNMPGEAEAFDAQMQIGPEAGSCFAAGAVPIPIRAEYRLSEGDQTVLGIQSGAPGCIGTLKASGLQITGDAGVAGRILGAVDFSTSAIGGRLDLAGPHARYGTSSCVVARGLRSDSIVYDAAETTQWARPPRIIDLFGAEFRILTASQPKPSNRLDWEQVERGIAPFFGSASDHCDPQAGYVRSSEESGRRDYQPAIYDALATGLERMGDFDQARKVRIIKNREYAANLSATDGWDQLSLWLTRFVYWLADLVSGYGHDNLKAVLWLAGLTLVGLVLGWIGEARLTFALSPIARFASWMRQGLRKLSDGIGGGLTRGWALARSSRAEGLVKATEQVGRKVRTLWPERPVAMDPVTKPRAKTGGERSDRDEDARGSPARPGLAFSIDRSIPSLGLDTAFGGHAGLGPILSTWFYTQRMLSFIILALMVASAFNVFQ